MNTIVRTQAMRSLFPSAQALITSSQSWDQGDLLVLDTTSHVIKKQSAETDSATFLGVAQCKLVDGKLPKPYTTDVDASAAISDVPGPVIGVVAKCVLKTGDSLNPGDLVGLDPATAGNGVTASITTESVGVYQGPAIASAPAGTVIEVCFEKFGSDLM